MSSFYQSAPDSVADCAKVEPLFKAVAGYRVWITGFGGRAKSRAALEERAAVFTGCPGGKQPSA